MDNYIELPRGGYLVQTSLGPVQFGVPPETIKDTMKMPSGVPNIFVLPPEMFDWIKGISVSEIEFPIYFNFFIKKRKTNIICREKQIESIKKILQEALFGPVVIDITNDYDETNNNVFIPNLKKEMDYFRSQFDLNDLVHFIPFKNGAVKISKKDSSEFIEVTIEDKSNYKIITDVGSLTIPCKINYNPKYLVGERLVEPYIPSQFGITCLGPSHGFDPEQNTSGFIIWLNHEGIMVDPPVNSTEWLIDSNVNPKLIDSIILTHCHADHDAGTFQKILQEERINIYTTETILMSFLRKYSAMSDIPINRLKKLFNFIPIKIGRSVIINGGKFDMFYSLHSIPTIGFKMSYQGKAMVYTSDHNNDPKKHLELYEKNIIELPRYDELRNFPWSSDVIYHEAGIPPLHTPVSFLNSLPPDIQKKIVVYHIAQKDFPVETDLSLAKFGIENTLYFKTKPHPHIESYKILGALKRLEFFQDIPIAKAQEFLSIVQIEEYKKGELIIKMGSEGDKFYIIYTGNISVVGSGELQKKKIYGTYDYFGEVALVTKQKRAADVYAETDVVLYTIDRENFLTFIAGTEFECMLKRLARIRNNETWNLLSTSKFFQYCSATQKTWLESMFIPMDMLGPCVFLHEGDYLEHIYIIRNGEVVMSQKGHEIAVLSKGDVIGAFQKIYDNDVSAYEYKTRSNLSVYGMPKDDIVKFLDKNPGLLMKIRYNY